MQPHTVVFDIDGHAGRHFSPASLHSPNTTGLQRVFAHGGGDRLNRWCAELIAAFRGLNRKINGCDGVKRIYQSDGGAAPDSQGMVEGWNQSLDRLAAYVV